MAKRGRKPEDGQTKTSAQRTKKWRLRKFGEPPPKSPAKTGAQRTRESYVRTRRRAARDRSAERLRANWLVIEPFLEEPTRGIVENVIQKVCATQDNSLPTSAVELSNLIELLNIWPLIEEALKRADHNETIRKLVNNRITKLQIVVSARFPLLSHLEDSSLQ